MSLETDDNLRRDEQFRRRVTSAILLAATNVRNESSGADNHANRLTWANRLVSQAQANAEAEKMIVSVAANPTISATFAAGQNQFDVPDSDITFVVDGLVDTYANAS